MPSINLLPRGVACACLLALLGACVNSPAVRTKPVYIDRPVATAVPAALTAGVEDAPIPDPLTNDGLVGLAEGERCRKTLANCQLERIEALQPGGARRAMRWCVRYSKICKVTP
jgi:hypothetical protein